MRPTLSRISAAALLAAAMAFGTPQAGAQVRTELPTSVIEAGTIGGGERSQIDQYIAQLSEQLMSTDAEAASRARASLAAPLAGRQPSVAFRQAYAQAVTPSMTTLLASEDAGARIAGLRVAGGLATGETAALIGSNLSNSDMGVRLFAAAQARRVFEVTSNAGAAVTESQANGLVDALKESVKAESDPLFVQAVIRALGTGAQIRTRELNATRARSLIALSQVGAERARGMNPSNPDADAETALVAMDLATRAVSEVGVTVTDDAAKAAAELGGEVLAVVLKRQNQNLIGDKPTEDIRLLRSGEALIYFARRVKVENAVGNPNSVPQTNLAGMLESKDRGFRNALVALIGPSSEFLRQFGLPDNRFVK